MVGQFSVLLYIIWARLSIGNTVGLMGQTTKKNQVEYQIEPLIVNGQLIGINFYSKLLSGQ